MKILKELPKSLYSQSYFSMNFQHPKRVAGGRRRLGKTHGHRICEVRGEINTDICRKLEMMKANSVSSRIVKVQFLFLIYSLCTAHSSSAPHTKPATLGEGQLTQKLEAGWTCANFSREEAFFLKRKKDISFSSFSCQWIYHFLQRDCPGTLCKMILHYFITHFSDKFPYNTY